MLFLVIVILFAIGVAGIVAEAKHRGYTWYGFVGTCLTIIAGLGLVISLASIGANCFGVDAKIASMNKRYESLVWQYENDIYDNDNDFGKRELMLDIQEWNEDLAEKRELQDNFWVGIYYPDIYDQFNFVEYGGSAE